MPGILDKFGKASIPTDVAIATTVKTTRTAGVNVLEAIDLSKYATDTPVFVVTYRKTTDPITGAVSITQLRSWKALVNVGANTLTNLTIQPGYADDIGNAVGDFIECIPTSAWENSLIDGILTSLNPDGTLKTSAVQAALGLVNNPSAGWTPLGVTQSGTIVHNGNRSYDVPFASSVASILSPGMRLLFDKTVPGNAYMGGAFNGSSHYFTKISPTGTLGTVTNNFTMRTSWNLSSYPASRAYLGGRSDATPNNGFGIFVEPSGQVGVAVFNGGVANLRSVTTYQSLSLTKKTDIAVSWASGTVVIYFDGVSVPVQAALTGGTAPTTAGTGGDFSIGRLGAYGAYANGYGSNFAVFDAVLSAATIRQYATYKLLGNEPNCIFSCTLDNTAVNQQNPGTNDLAAQGGVGFTAASPHGMLGHYIDTTKAVGLVMAVNGSTVTVQCPEGCTIPTTGGITSVSYATSGNPFGWVGDEGRWIQKNSSIVNTQNAAFVNNAYQNPNGRSLYLNKGSYKISGNEAIYAADAGVTVDMAISSSATTFADSPTAGISVSDSKKRITSVNAGNTVNADFQDIYANVTSPTTLYLVTQNQSGATKNVSWTEAENPCYLQAVPMGL